MLEFPAPHIASEHRWDWVYISLEMAGLCVWCAGLGGGRNQKDLCREGREVLAGYKTCT